jgi:hypothetical protein
MNRPRNRWALRLAVILAAGGVMLLWALKQQVERMLTIVNQSGQTVAEMTITSGEETVTYRDIADGKDVSVPFVTRSDQPMTIAVRMQNGSTLRRIGHAPEQLRLSITPVGIESQPGTRR